MTDATGADVWSALYSPFGGAYTLSGSETLNARFPGQFCCSTLGKPVLMWFQMLRAFRPARGTRVGRRIKQAGLHYNWHRH
ncbi:MAG: hypothetical protein AB7S74_17855 [Hyphomicrobium sp.]